MARIRLRRVRTLSSFLEWAAQFSDGNYVFRGVPNQEYGIQASAYRRTTKRERDSDDQGFEAFLQVNKDLIDEAQLRGYDQKNGRQLNDLEILTELQHFRAATCLIDFTHSAQIALWFACQRDPKTPQDTTKQPNGKVFAVRNDPDRFKEIKPNLLKEKFSYFFEDSNKTQLFHWQPSQQNNRIIAQQSIFLFGHYEFDADEECVILASGKEEILTELELVSGITEMRLFPDFDGFARLRSEEIPHELSAFEYRKRADRSYQNENFKEAIADYSEVIRLKPDASAFYQRGLAKTQLKRYEAAIDDFDEAIHLDPYHASAFYQNGLAKVQLKQYEEAIADYDEVIHLKPDDESAYYQRGLVKTYLQQYEAAIADYDEAIHLNPGDPSIYHQRGLAKEQLKRFKGAREDYQTAERLADRVSHPLISEIKLRLHEVNRHIAGRS